MATDSWSMCRSPSVGRHVGRCRHPVRVSSECRPPPDRRLDRHSIDMSTDSWSMCPPSVGRHTPTYRPSVDRYPTDASTDTQSSIGCYESTKGPYSSLNTNANFRSCCGSQIPLERCTIPFFAPFEICSRR